MAEYIEREAAMTTPVLPKEYRKYQTDNLDDAYEQGWLDALDNLKNAPAVSVPQWISVKERMPKMGDIHQTIKAGAKSVCPDCDHYPVCRAVENQPCVECNHFSLVVRGRWNKEYRSGVTVAEGFVSSCCDIWNERAAEYCPCCGARMKKDGETDE